MAGGRCTACEHPQRAEIDRAIATDRFSERSIAKQYGLGHVSVHRHKKHVAEALVEIHRTVRRELDLRVFDGLQRIYTRMMMVIDACDKKLYDPVTGEYRVDLTAIVPLVQASAELRKTIESAAKFYAQVEAERQLKEADEARDGNLQALFQEALGGDQLTVGLVPLLETTGVSHATALLVAETIAPGLLSLLVAAFAKRTEG